MLGWLRRGRRLSAPEQNALKTFCAMSLNDVRRRGDEFEAAQRNYDDWLASRARRDGPPEGSELAGFAPEVQYGDPARRWRELEQRLRADGHWLVDDLPDSETLEWARKLNALSETLSRPNRHLGPEVPPARASDA